MGVGDIFYSSVEKVLKTWYFPCSACQWAIAPPASLAMQLLSSAFGPREILIGQ